VWALTPNGAELAANIKAVLPDADLHLSAGLEGAHMATSTFERLNTALTALFHKYRGHIFIMSTGIVVRLIAPLIRHKTTDPAVVVLDEKGRHAISLLAGHIGGANALANRVAGAVGATPVITTATDINDVPAIDVLAIEQNLRIENPGAIKGVNMALLAGGKIYLHDPFGILRDRLPASSLYPPPGSGGNDCRRGGEPCPEDPPGVFVDDIKVDLPPQMLVLRPRSLVAGMGCNRNTSREEMKSFLMEILNAFGLSAGSLRQIATITIKKDEPGLIALANELEIPLVFFEKEELGGVENIKTPSAMVEKHIGVKSVCEAAAILAAKGGRLIVPKQATRNVTVAIARTFSMS
jgi:cobalt-precorrin 5A hydrolase